MRIAFIGGGNMATALISSLFASRHTVNRVKVSDPDPGVKERLQERWPVACFEKAADAITGMEAIVLAVKPQVLPLVLDEISELVTHEQHRLHPHCSTHAARPGPESRRRAEPRRDQRLESS